MMSGFAVVGAAERKRLSCPKCGADVDLQALCDGRYDTTRLTDEERRNVEDSAQGCAGLIAGVAAIATWIVLYQLISGAWIFWGGAIVAVVAYNIAAPFMRPKSEASVEPEPAVAMAPPPPDPAPAHDLRVVLDSVESVMQQWSKLGDERGRAMIVVSTDDARLAAVKRRLLDAGVVSAAIAAATADGADRLDAIRAGDVRCILLNPGPGGPTFTLPLEAYRKCDVMVLNPQEIGARAMARIHACIDGDAAAAPAAESDESSMLARELVEIGRKVPQDRYSASWFLSSARGRAREIGARLNELGGIDRMLAAHESVRQALGGVAARELEAAWGGIGEWMS